MKKITLFLLILSAFQAFSADYAFTINGKHYKIITTQKTWVDAAQWAAADGGYLVEINSQMEQDSIWAAIQNSGIPTNYTVVNDGGGIAYIWIGANDLSTEGNWVWNGNNDSLSSPFYVGEGQWGTGNGSALGNAYVNWGGTSSSGGTSSKEPDNYANIQDAAGIGLEAWPKGSGTNGGGIASEWNDISASNTLYFIVEYESVGINEKYLPILPKMHIRFRDQNSIFLKANLPIISIEIYNAIGEKIMENRTLHSNEFFAVLPRNGIYFFRSKFKNGQVLRGKI